MNWMSSLVKINLKSDYEHIAIICMNAWVIAEKLTSKKFYWKFNQDIRIFIQENWFENQTICNFFPASTKVII